MGGASLPGIYSNDYPAEFDQYNTQYPGNKEIIGWQWWDTQTYISGTTVSLPQWFNVRSTPDLGNMEVAFQLSAPKAFFLRAVRFFVKQRPALVSPPIGNPQTGAIDNVAQLINTGVFTLTIGSKIYVMSPIWTLTAGGGAFGVMAMSSSGAVLANFADYGQNGIPDPRSVMTLSKPLFIAPQINFSAVAQWPAALTLSGGNTAICFLMDGDLVRPIQ